MRLRDLVKMHELRYPSNILSMSRLTLVPITLILLRQPERRRAAMICLALTMLTDAIDGPLARARGEVSQLGEVLDPIADKLLLDGAAVILSQTRGFPWWATGLLIFRDISILLAAIVVIKRRDQVTAAASAGKLTTVLLTAAALLYAADGPRSGYPVLLAAMVPFSISFVQYGYRFIQLIRQPPE
ncbi:CDP-alcohol phosphatidyltransferase family protein [Candidatus Viridilinea mediisalina]|uniref:CDP-alcohol phosphatidyltransferase n=1 Tax=Candidatus Viridilinea mediisalina TaxID=2024553 RepID=A0A2A6RGR2_9CHLR|nr:CDP-alcohol phosphatidyltransferase family protein [Candidatus Viridilinea mediisalina]PDW02076.1 CDP-alcohol phosphatidyltransferase [Candidatus Viridilinea mediisalina]